jgi:RNA polymerase sigma-70 factor (ECF subfamily)
VADDISQEAFLRVLRAAPTYKPAASFTTWLYRIVVNLCLDAQRYRGTLQLVREEDQYAATRPVDRRLVQDEAVHAVQGEVAALPERERIVVVLHRFQGLSHCQIAQATGWTEPAVESLLVRAYARLRERLHEWAEI